MREEEGVGEVVEVEVDAKVKEGGVIEMLQMKETADGIEVEVEVVEVGERVEAVGEAVEVGGAVEAGISGGEAEKEHLTLGIVKAIGFKHTSGFEIERIVFAVEFLILKWRCFTFKEHFLFGSLEQS